MYTKAKFHRGSIVIDYIFQRKCLRYPTGISGIPKDKKYFNKGTLSRLVKDHDHLNLHISNLLSDVDKIIQDYVYENKSNPSVQHVKEKIESRRKVVKIHYDNAIDYYNEFYRTKSNDPIVSQTLKDYKSTQNALMLYESRNGRLTIEKMNSDIFLKDFEKFLSDPFTEKEQKKFRVRGMLNNNTINKRIGCIRTFLFWLENNEKITLSPKVRSYKTSIHKYDPVNVTLTLDELRTLKHLDLKNKEEQLRDVFLFLCLVGMRYSDLLTLTAHDVNDDYVISKDAQKTFKGFRVQMNTDARRIYDKYNGKLNIFSTTEFNRSIKEFLAKYDLLIDKVRILKIYHNNRSYQEITRWKLVGTHTGRRTFINLMVEKNTDISSLMIMTGHVKMDMLLKYFDRNRPAENLTEKIAL